MTAVDAVKDWASHQGNATPAPRSAAPFARSDVGIPRQRYAAICPTTHRGTHTGAGEDDPFALLFAEWFATGFTSPPSATWPGRTAGDAAGGDPGALYFLAAALVAGQRAAQAAPLLRRLDTVAAQRRDRQLWRRRVEFLWAVHAERSADSGGVLDHCRAANARVPSDGSSASPRPDQDHESFLLAVDALISDQLPLLVIRAHIRLGQAQLAQARLESHFGGQTAAEASQPSTVALLACQHGRLNDARRLATVAMQTAEPPGEPTELMELDVLQVLAQVGFERNELDLAQGYLETALRRSWSSPAPPYMWMVEADLVRVMIARQEPAAALHRLHGLRLAIGPEPVSPPLALKLNQADLEARLSLGDLDGALQLVRSLPAPELPWETVVRLDLSMGRPDRALTRLGSGSVSGLAAEIRQLVLRACGERQEGRAQRAQDTMRRAVEVARPEHYVRPFLETPILTVAPLRGLLNSHPDPYLSELVGQAEQLVAPTSLRSSVGMLEPLTERERQVLCHLPSHHNLPQIGAVMGLSTNTIKTHAKSIYRKTGAASRDDAVTIARSHGLL